MHWVTLVSTADWDVKSPVGGAAQPRQASAYLFQHRAAPRKQWVQLLCSGATGLFALPRPEHWLRTPFGWEPANGNGVGGRVPVGESRTELLACLRLGAGPAAGDFWGSAQSVVPGQAGNMPLHPGCAADREPPEVSLRPMP